MHLMQKRRMLLDRLHLHRYPLSLYCCNDRLRDAACAVEKLHRIPKALSQHAHAVMPFLRPQFLVVATLPIRWRKVKSAE
jgi:hypothetical protein